MAYRQTIHLFNLSTQEGESLTTILDINKVESIVNDLKLDLMMDVVEDTPIDKILYINAFKVLNISE